MFLPQKTKYDAELEKQVAANPDAYVIFVNHEEFGVGDGFDYQDGEDFLIKRAAELGSLDKLASEMDMDSEDFLSNLIEYPDDIDNLIVDCYQGIWSIDLKDQQDMQVARG